MKGFGATGSTSQARADSANLCFLIAWPGLPVSLAIAATQHTGANRFSGGFAWPSMTYALWEPFVAWGFIAIWLLVFREHMNQPSGFWDWANRRAFAVYIIHPPVLVSIALALHGWSAPALLKFAVTGALTVIIGWLLADPLVRLPGVRRVI